MCPRTARPSIVSSDTDERSPARAHSIHLELRFDGAAPDRPRAAWTEAAPRERSPAGSGLVRAVEELVTEDDGAMRT